MYLLDTDTIIYILKGQEAAVLNLREHLNDPLNICAVSLMELYYGAYKSRKVESNLAKVRALEKRIEVLPVGEETAGVFGLTKANLERAGTPLDDFDLCVAACALTHNLVLATNNIRHFRRVEGLRLTNWTRFPSEEA